MKFSTHEPAERPLTIALSYAEVVAVANWHISQARKIPARAGRASLELRASSPFSTTRQNNELFKVAKEQLAAHSKRAQGLLSLIPKS